MQLRGLQVIESLPGLAAVRSRLCKVLWAGAGGVDGVRGCAGVRCLGAAVDQLGAGRRRLRSRRSVGVSASGRSGRAGLRAITLRGALVGVASWLAPQGAGCCRCGVVALGLSLWGLGPGVVRRAAGLPASWHRGVLVVLAWALRSIPACAGDPLVFRPPEIRPEVYPRVCGGSANILRKYGLDKGLSPRVRGILPRRIRFKGVVGSIPACAGDPHRTTLPAMLQK